MILMKCPFCSFDETKVVDTREAEDADVTRRRRECLKCEKRFTTYERSEGVDLVVVKKDDSREPFERSKMLDGMVKACQKRPIQTERLQNISHEIESSLRRDFGPEVPASEIGRLVMEKLRALDPVAYIRFASVYREFEDAESFQREVAQLVGKRKKDP